MIQIHDSLHYTLNIHETDCFTTKTQKRRPNETAREKTPKGYIRVRITHYIHDLILSHNPSNNKRKQHKQYVKTYSQMNHQDDSSTFPTNASGQLNVPGHDRNPLGVNRTEIRIFEQTHQVCFSCFLKCKNGMALKPQIHLQQNKASLYNIECSQQRTKKKKT